MIRYVWTTATILLLAACGVDGAPERPEPRRPMPEVAVHNDSERTIADTTQPH